MATIWFDTVTCRCADSTKSSEVTVRPRPADNEVMLTIRRSNGKAVTLRLAPGWARVLANLLDQAAAHVREAELAGRAAPATDPTR